MKKVQSEVNKDKFKKVCTAIYCVIERINDSTDDREKRISSCYAISEIFKNIKGRGEKLLILTLVLNEIRGISTEQMIKEMNQLVTDQQSTSKAYR
jgi:hypothetical protein